MHTFTPQKKPGHQSKPAYPRAQSRASSVDHIAKKEASTGLSMPLEHKEPFLIQRTCACGGGCPRCEGDMPIQAKLKIGAPNDKYEQEADRVADLVMRMPVNSGQLTVDSRHGSVWSKGKTVQTKSLSQQVQRECNECEKEDEEQIQRKPLISRNTPLIQRQTEEDDEEQIQTKPISERITPLIQRQEVEDSDEEEEEDSIQAKPLAGQITPIVQRQSIEEEEDEVQTKPVIQREVEDKGSVQAKRIMKKAEGKSVASSCVENSLSLPKDEGAPLSTEAQGYMGSRFGADFSNVRIYTGHNAVQLSQRLGARAFTHGNNIYFNEGQYNPVSSSGKHLLAHELSHTVQQNAANNMVQRSIKTGDGHDLTSSFLAGDKKLEECFDGKRTFNYGSNGESVEKLQKGLMFLGFSLPSGDDGIYKKQTKKAVIEFQKSSGLTGGDVDGVVGKRTIGLLDVALRHGKVTSDTDKKGDDFKVIGKYKESKGDRNRREKRKERERIYFELAKADLDTDELDKIAKLAKKHIKDHITLKGSASEEGSASFNKRLAIQRAEAVAAIMRDVHKHPSVVVDPRPYIAEGQIEYQKMRSVKIVLKGEAPKPDPHCPKSVKSTGSCTQDVKSKLKIAVKKAIELVGKTEKELPPTTDKTKQLFDSLFATDKTTRIKVSGKVKTIMGLIKNHVGKMTVNNRHQCGNECDNKCKNRPAYNSDTSSLGKHGDKYPPGLITLCPLFKDQDLIMQAIVLIHEGHHGVAGIPSKDIAYHKSRLLTKLATSEAMRNASSFHVFAQMINDPSKDTSVPIKKDVFNNISTAGRQAIELPIAWIQQWFSLNTFDVISLYGDIHKAKGKRRIKQPQRKIMKFISPRFGLTPHTRTPTMRDQVAVAAIYHRLQLMEDVLDSQLTFNKINSGVSFWQKGPGTTISLTPDFFSPSLLPSRKTIYLLQELVRATSNISAKQEPEYVALIHFLRKNYRNLGGPTP